MNDPRSAPPIFVVGVPRSGTTLLSAMLAAHPRLVCGPETHFFDQLVHVDARGICRRAGWPKDAIDYIYSIKHVGESIPANYGLTREELTEALARRKPSIPAILSGMMELYMDRVGKRRWIEKTPDHLPYVARIRRYYPDSPIVRIVRDPRDVAASLLAVWWGPGSLLKAIDVWRTFDDRSARFFEVDSRCHTLRYEDLVLEPEPTLRELCRFLDESFDPDMLDTSRSARLVNAANEPWKTKVAEKPDASRVEAWRQKLSGEELRLVEAYLGDRLRSYDYPLLGFDCPHFVEVHPLTTLDDYPEVLAELVSRGARFWRLPGERPELSLFLGNPNAWRLGNAKPARLARTAGLLGTIARRRLAGVPLAWFQPPEQAPVPGLCPKLLSWALPSPTSRHHVPEFAHPSNPAKCVVSETSP